jgi:hypothetical protein
MLWKQSVVRHQKEMFKNTIALLQSRSYEMLQSLRWNATSELTDDTGDSFDILLTDDAFVVCTIIIVY